MAKIKSHQPSSIQPPPGFAYFTDFISQDEETKLLKEISTFTWQAVKMHGIIAKRRVLHFGMDYSYNSRVISPTVPPPSFLLPFIERAANVLKINPEEIVEVLISEYSPGAGIGWHKDAAIFGEKVFGFSLLNSCLFKLRNPREPKNSIYKLELAPRSAYVLSGPSRLEWQHCIAPVKQLRYSITFRTLR